MNKVFTPRGARRALRLLSAGVLGAGLLAATLPVHAATAAVYGSIGNFDVINHTGHDAHGFEIEIQGATPADAYYTFSYQRYGQSTISSTATGIKVRWAAQSLGNGFSATTAPYTGGGSFGGTCYMGGLNYDAAGCEHFGVSIATNALATYRWLVEDPANPGTLIPSDPAAPVAQPIYTVVPPVRVGDPPVLQVDVQAPEAPENPAQYGDAQWMRVFVTQVPRAVTLDELLTTNPIVPQDPAQLESNWSLVQAEPAAIAAGNGKHTRSRKRMQGSLKPDTRSVVRRIEMYAYTGAYDPVTHEALCADGTCNAPSAGELGDQESAQMTAALVQQNNITVTKSGTGTVASSDAIVSCGSKCSGAWDAGHVVALTATPGSGSVFRGWGGACAAAGAARTCNVTVNGAMNVSANFATSLVLSAKTSGGAGLVVSTPAGLNCGSGGNACNVTVLPGSLYSISATPAAGYRFVGWSGGCSGTGLCNVIVNASTTVQANFTK